MDYEKKYKETLERARKWYNDSHITIGLKGNLKDIFPELAEPDDERIRKILIDYFDDANKSDENPLQSYGIQTDEVIAWLEKQDEIDLEHYKDGENEKRKFVGYGFLKCKGDFLSFKEGETYWLEYIGKDNYNVRSDNLLGQTFYIKPVELYTVFCPTTWLEKQGEQKEIDYNEELKKCKDNPLYFFDKYVKIKLKEQKPVWSEEDEHRVKDTIYFLDAAKKHYASVIELDACIDWLKSLKDRVQTLAKIEKGIK